VTPAQLSRTVLLTLRDLLRDRPDAVPHRVVVESPPRRGGGDYATGAALAAARACGHDPRALADALAVRLAARPGVARAEVSGAGFVNLTLDATGRAALLRSLLDGAPGADARDAPAADAARWAALTGEQPSELLVRTHARSTLFRVQYAHARARALVRNGADLGLTPEPGAGGHPCGHPAERALLAVLADHARVAAAGDGARHARHLTAVADAFADVRDACDVLPRGDEKPGAAHRARLALAEATGAVLAGGLSRLGVTAPAHV
jgi:arginyl-tRNA synthetase